MTESHGGETSVWGRRIQWVGARKMKRRGVNVSIVTYQRSEPAFFAVNMPTGNRSQRICVWFLSEKTAKLEPGNTSRKVVRSRMNGLILFESTIEQTTETLPLTTKQ